MADKNLLEDLAAYGAGMGLTSMTIIHQLRNSIDPESWDDTLESWCISLIVIGSYEEQKECLEPIPHTPEYKQILDRVQRVFGEDRRNELHKQLMDQIDGLE